MQTKPTLRPRPNPPERFHVMTAFDRSYLRQLPNLFCKHLPIPLGDDSKDDGKDCEEPTTINQSLAHYLHAALRDPHNTILAVGLKPSVDDCKYELEPEIKSVGDNVTYLGAEHSAEHATENSDIPSFLEPSPPILGACTVYGFKKFKNVQLINPIVFLWVLPGFRRQGIGSYLLRATHSMYCCDFKCFVDIDNTPAQMFLKHYGSTSILRPYVPTYSQHAIHLEHIEFTLPHKPYKPCKLHA